MWEGENCVQDVRRFDFGGGEELGDGVRGGGHGAER